MNKGWRVLPLLFPILASAQQDSVTTPDMSLQHRLTIDASAGYDSNVLGNDLVMGIYRGRVLGSDVRQRTLDDLGNADRAGYELVGRATYTWADSLFGRATWMPRISLAYQSVMGVRFAADAYALSFFGNAGFEDRTAHLGPGAFEQVNYQTFAIGIEGRNSGSFVELAFVNGRSLNAGRIQKADLYTAPYGRYLELQLDGEYHRSDTAGHNLSNGTGAAINMRWQHGFHLFRSPALLSLGVTDLGFIAWNHNSLSVRKDSTLRYEGVQVTDILDLDGLLVNSTTLQDSLGLDYSKGGVTRALPARAEARIGAGRFHKRSSFQGMWPYELSVVHRYLPGHIPHAAIVRNFILAGPMAISVGAGYGGFGDLRALAGLMGMLGKHLRIGVRTPNAIGLFSDQANGKAIALGLEAAW